MDVWRREDLLSGAILVSGGYLWDFAWTCFTSTQCFVRFMIDDYATCEIHDLLEYLVYLV